MKYCDNCDKVLSKRIVNNMLTMLCTNCMKEYPLSPTDTVMYKENVVNTVTSQYISIIKNAAHDATTKKVYRNCTACPSTIMAIVITGEDMNYNYSCVCGAVQ